MASKYRNKWVNYRRNNIGCEPSHILYSVVHVVMHGVTCSKYWCPELAPTSMISIIMQAKLDTYIQTSWPALSNTCSSHDYEEF